MDSPPSRPALAVAAVVVLALAAGGWWWHAHRESRQDPDRLDLAGNVDIRQVSLAFNASERIVELGPHEGDQVAAGQVLGRLDTRTPTLKLQQADAQAEVAAQALQRLRAGSRPEEVSQANANVAAAQADVDQAAAQLRRLQDVSAATQGRGVSRLDLDNALERQKAALARRDAARDSAHLVAQGPRREDIAQARAQLDAANAERALLARQIEESVLRAPVAAVVRSRLLEPGEIASPQRAVFTLAIQRPKWVRTYVAEPELPRVSPGLAATVTADGMPGAALDGRVGYVSSVAEFTPKSVETKELRTSLVYEVRVMVDDPRDQLRLGMPATVHLRLPPATAASGVASSASAR